jgi:hypothetical protein
MEDIEIKIGDAFWGRIGEDHELHVFRKLKNGIFVADNWEGSFKLSEIEFIELIKKPKKDKI